MKQLYNKNGLIFWSEEEIQIRENIEKSILLSLKTSLKEQNSAFDFVKVETPLLIPNELVNANYTEDDVFKINDLTLRPETTIGTYFYATELLNTHNNIKYRTPLVVYQHGKSFRVEQDQPTKFMRLKEFYQLEFQIIYGLTTANDYSIKVIEDIRFCLSKITGKECLVEASDRLPDYSEQTTDIICNGMEICSISKRKDFSGYKILEVAIGTDRLIYQITN